MTRADDYILEFLGDNDLVSTPKVIAANIDYSRQYVNERLSPLSEHELVENTGGGLYRITERGQEYLAGDLTADELEG